MVMRVCRGVLADPHDTQDAFQATFLTLARKAGSIRRPAALGGWLYQVAYRVALRARAGRRASTGKLLADVPAPPADDPVWRDLRPVLDAMAAWGARHRKRTGTPFIPGGRGRPERPIPTSA